MSKLTKRILLAIGQVVIVGLIAVAITAIANATYESPTAPGHDDSLTAGLGVPPTNTAAQVGAYAAVTKENCPTGLCGLAGPVQLTSTGGGAVPPQNLCPGNPQYCPDGLSSCVSQSCTKGTLQQTADASAGTNQKNSTH